MLTTMQTESDVILDRATLLWNYSRTKARDAAIQVGNLLIEFIVARMREADGLNEQDRRERNLTREFAIELAADRLGIKLAKAHEIIRVSRVVHLFGDPGSLSYSTLRAFVSFVTRKPCVLARGRQVKEGETTPSNSEVWVVKPTPSGLSPQHAYQQAVEENWDSTKVRAVTRQITAHRGRGRHPKLRESRDTTGQTSLRKIAETADPRDIADMILEMVSACPNRGVLKGLLIKALT